MNAIEYINIKLARIEMLKQNTREELNLNILSMIQGIFENDLKELSEMEKI